MKHYRIDNSNAKLIISPSFTPILDKQNLKAVVIIRPVQKKILKKDLKADGKS